MGFVYPLFMKRMWIAKNIDIRALTLSLVVGALVVTLGWAASIRDVWGLLLSNAGSSTFGDLNIVTTTAGCLVDPGGLDVRGRLCSNWVLDPTAYPPEPYNYPQFWYKSLAEIGISGESTYWLGMFLIILFALSIGGLSYVTLKGASYPSRAVTILFLSLTPPSLLAMERGNTDIIVFSLIVTSIYALQYPRTLLAPLLLASATVFKLFPLGSAVALLVATNNRLRGVFVFSSLVVAGVSTYLTDFSKIAERTPQTTSLSFGSTILPQILSRIINGQDLSPNYARIIGLAIFLVFTLAFWFVVNLTNLGFAESRLGSTWSRFINDLTNDQSAKRMFLIGTGSFCFTYLLGSNFDYRVIFILPVLFALLRLQRIKSAAPWVLILLSIVFLLGNSDAGYSTIADIILLLIVPALAVAVAQIVLPYRFRL